MNQPKKINPSPEDRTRAIIKLLLMVKDPVIRSRFAEQQLRLMEQQGIQVDRHHFLSQAGVESNQDLNN